MTKLLFILLSIFIADTDYYNTRNGTVIFESNASLENIKAKSTQLRGLINKSKNTFSFAIKLKSFHGFNSELQMEHYNENYVESDLFNEATFKGKIIEDLNWLSKGRYEVRAKGEFELHGIKKIETINSVIEVTDEKSIKISAEFKINLSDYNIKIPRIVHKKLSEKIDIQVNAVLQKTVN